MSIWPIVLNRALSTLSSTFCSIVRPEATAVPISASIASLSCPVSATDSPTTPLINDVGTLTAPLDTMAARIFLPTFCTGLATRLLAVASPPVVAAIIASVTGLKASCTASPAACFLRSSTLPSINFLSLDVPSSPSLLENGCNRLSIPSLIFCWSSVNGFIP